MRDRVAGRRATVELGARVKVKRLLLFGYEMRGDDVAFGRLRLVVAFWTGGHDESGRIR